MKIGVIRRNCYFSTKTIEANYFSRIVKEEKIKFEYTMEGNVSQHIYCY